MRYVLLCTTLALAGCENTYAEGVPLASSAKQTKLYTIMQPLCVLICSNPVSVVREDVFSGGQGGSIATGAKSNTQSGAFTGGQRSTDIN